MSIIIRQSTNFKLAKAIHDIVEVLGVFNVKRGTKLWLAWDGEQPVGYATVNPFKEEGLAYGFLAGCAVLPLSRGQGVQKRLIRARDNWCKKQLKYRPQLQ